MPKILVFTIAFLLTTVLCSSLCYAQEDQLITIVQFLHDDRDVVMRKHEIDLANLLDAEDGFLCPAVTYDSNGEVRVEFEIGIRISDKHDSKKSLSEACTRKMKTLKKICANLKTACDLSDEQAQTIEEAAITEVHAIKRKAMSLVSHPFQFPIASTNKVQRVAEEINAFNSRLADAKDGNSLFDKVLNKTLNPKQQSQLRWGYMQDYVEVLKQARIYTTDAQVNALRELVVASDAPPHSLRANQLAQHELFVKLCRAQTPSPFTERGWLQIQHLKRRLLNDRKKH